MPQGFAFRGVFARSAPFPAYSVSVIVSTGYYLLLASFFFLVKSHFLLGLSTFEVRSLGRL